MSFCSVAYVSLVVMCYILHGWHLDLFPFCLLLIPNDVIVPDFLSGPMMAASDVAV